ncbi:unnamed protein product [Pleuronectes platessa]|uniref:Uncharacterized protein n=1 Tax=Pleuronectes platessa TaxID=8262 RepID=A0A9N7Z053_PLEPL|nr:unnamed protein product [Pleuronectes platessa]
MKKEVKTEEEEEEEEGEVKESLDDETISFDRPVNWSVSMLESAGRRLGVPRPDLDRCLAASVGHHDPARGRPV